jgi:uncharacterized protein YbjQ (UPF0145 family)
VCARTSSRARQVEGYREAAVAQIREASGVSPAGVSATRGVAGPCATWSPHVRTLRQVPKRWSPGGVGIGRPPGRAAPEKATDSALISTTNNVPGHEIVDVHGDVFDLIVRTRNTFWNFAASMPTIAGGEPERGTSTWRREAIGRGADGAIAMRFDCNEIADVMSEVAVAGRLSRSGTST